MENNINTNLNDYSIEELINLLELKEDFTKEDVIQKISFLNNNNIIEDNKINDFINDIQNKLFYYLNEINSENILPNYGDYIENENIENMENMENNENNENNENMENIRLEREREIEPELDTQFQNEEGFSSVMNDYNLIENYNIYNYLHFNTLFRSKNNSLLDTIVPSTNSNFLLSSPINNISRIKLASINIKKPYLISNSKSNNTFIIKKFVKINDISTCDFTSSIVIENGYYDNPKSLEDYLNNNYFNNSTNANSFMKSINFSINENSNKILFELSNDYINSNGDFLYFSLDFKTNYTKYYSLATILGFEYNKSANYYTSLIDGNNRTLNNQINSTYSFKNKGNCELFFCFDEFQSNIVETHKLFLNNNMSTQKILAKINGSLGKADTNFYINETYSITDDRNDHIRQYDGVINLLNFNIKIIDYYGNIINLDDNEDFTFTLEVKIDQKRIKI